MGIEVLIYSITQRTHISAKSSTPGPSFLIIEQTINGRKFTHPKPIHTIFDKVMFHCLPQLQELSVYRLTRMQNAMKNCLHTPIW